MEVRWWKDLGAFRGHAFWQSVNDKAIIVMLNAQVMVYFCQHGDRYVYATKLDIDASIGCVMNEVKDCLLRCLTLLMTESDKLNE